MFLNGGKHGTSAAYRDIYSSHLGRLDMNVCSSSDPGLTGYLTCNCQVDERGYFGGKDSEPDCYDPVIDARLAAVANPKYAKKRLEIMMTEADRKDNGFIELRRKPSSIQMTKMFSDHPERYGLYAIGNRLKLLPKMDRNNKGFIKLEKKPGATLDLRAKPDRNSDGFLVLRYSKDKLTYK